MLTRSTLDTTFFYEHIFCGNADILTYIDESIHLRAELEKQGNTGKIRRF